MTKQKFNETIYWYNRFSGKPDDIFHLDGAGVTHPDKNYRIERAHPYHNMFVLEYVVSGRGYIESAGKVTPVSAGDFYLVNCKTVHKYYSDSENPYEKKWLNIYGSFIPNLARTFSLNDAAFSINLGEPCGEIFNAVHDKIKATTPKNAGEMTDFIMRKILDLFLLADKTRSAGDKELESADKIARYIDKNICLDINVSVVCKLFYLSPSTVYRLFMTRFGMSPKDYILAKKIETAKKMICYDNAPLNVVAASLNFYDSHHLFNAFKTVTGQSPTEFKNAFREGREGSDSKLPQNFEKV